MEFSTPGKGADYQLAGSFGTELLDREGNENSTPEGSKHSRRAQGKKG